MPAGKILFWLYLLVLVSATGMAFNPADPDLWHRLATGEMLWQTGRFPTGETFSYLADYHLIADHEWGSAVIFYGLYALGGGSAIVALKVLTLAVTVGLIASASLFGRRPGVLLAAFNALVLLGLLPSFQSTVRSMVFTNLILALWVYWYRKEEQGRIVPWWAYVLTMIAWVNLHGGFVIGLAWLGVLGVLRLKQGEGGLRALVRLGLCTLATLLNPFGWALWPATLRALFVNRAGFGEWDPVSWWPDLLEYPGYKLLVFVSLIGLGYLAHRRGVKALARPPVILILAAFVLSLMSGRHTSIFVIVAGALLPGVLPPLPSTPERSIRLGSIAIGALLMIFPLFGALRLVPQDSLQLQLPANSCPVRAVDFLSAGQVQGKLLVPFNYGSYALWRLRGKMRVSMDGRFDLVYRASTYQRVDDFFAGRASGSSLLQNPQPDAVLLPKADPVFARLQTDPGWAEVYHDETDAVFLPRTIRP